MKQFFPPPANCNEINLADWIEITVIRSPKKTFNLSELETILRKSGLFETSDSTSEIEQRKIEDLCRKVNFEIGNRITSAQESYPFKFDKNILKPKSDFKRFRVYIYCLCLSYFSLEKNIKVNIIQRRLFEELSCIASQKFFNGKSLKFGWPRTKMNSKFEMAIEELCNWLGEGGGFKDQPLDKSKDRQLDLVAWLEFPDGKSGKFIIFGQCSTGNNWETKTKELEPLGFCKNWLKEVPKSQIVKAFFIPHRVPSGNWDRHTVDAGIIFDRCRISYLASKQKKLEKSYLKNCEKLLSVKIA